MMNKKELKAIMEEILANESDHDRDDWYCTSREVAEYGLKLLADKLNIELEGS
jgi:hypothetical protein